MIMKHDFLPALLAVTLCLAPIECLADAANPRAAAPTSLPDLVEPPPLDAGIVAMMKTNNVGSLEVRIHFVESWELSPFQKAQVFFAMFEKAASDDQRKLAHAAVKYAANSNYNLLRRYLLNSQLPRPVLSVFMTDTLKRDNRTKMPVLLALARQNGHPMQSEAQELLKVYLGQSHGTNWSKWEEAMLAWLQKHPN